MITLCALLNLRKEVKQSAIGLLLCVCLDAVAIALASHYL